MGIVKDTYTRLVLRPLADYLKEVAQGGGDVSKAANAGAGAVLRDQLQYANRIGTPRSKPGAGISFATLRKFSVQYDVARAAINRRKRQLNQLDWDISNADPDDKTDRKKETKALKQQFVKIGGYRVRFRELMDVMVEDLLVLDAVAIYKRPTRAGQLYNLLPVDASTIKLNVDDAGMTPAPPAVAYEQWIRGKQVAEFTADEMYYEMLNPRTNTPYGLSPLESLILGVSAALKSEVFNVNMLTEGNIPEGLFGVPPEWTPDQIKEFQLLWDAAVAGDASANNKLKFVPSGPGATGYQPTVKPEDMRYKELQEWLMKKTCMLFEIQPQELGFTDTVNKSTGEVQQDIGFRTGLRPLAMFFEEIFTDVLQVDMGYPDLRFHFQGLDDVDEKAQAEIAEIEIRSGQRTVDEIRSERGWDPLGIDKPFVLGNPTFIDEESVNTRNQAAAALISMGSESKGDQEAGDRNENANDNTNEPTEEKSAEQKHIQLVTELRAFRKYAINRVKEGKQLRRFESKVLPEVVVDELNQRIAKAQDVEAVREVFTEYFKDYQINFLAEVANLKSDLQRIL